MTVAQGASCPVTMAKSTLPSWTEAIEGPLAIDWEHEANEWAHHLAMALTEEVGGRSFEQRTGGLDASIPHFEFALVGEALRSRLWIVPDPDGLFAFVVGDDDGPQESSVEPWRRAVRAAVERLGKNHPDFPWSAVIGHDPDEAQTANQTLATPSRVGPLQLTPASVRFHESRDLQVPDLLGRALVSSWPIIVEGTARGYNWWTASGSAAMDLHRLCSLLSLEWDAHWMLRRAPHERVGQTLVLPTHSPLDSAAERHIAQMELQNLRLQSAAPLDLPPWIDVAWRTLEANKDLARALGAYQEGRALFHRHPSFALVAFVAVVETVGRTMIARPSPSPCAECKRTKGDAMDRFRDGLRLVLEEDEARALCQQVYPPRSKTAHGGSLHGLEGRFGVFYGRGILGQDDPTDFAWSVVYKLRAVSRRVLLHSLGGLAASDAASRISPPARRGQHGAPSKGMGRVVDLARRNAVAAILLPARPSNEKK